MARSDFPVRWAVSAVKRSVSSPTWRRLRDAWTAASAAAVPRAVAILITSGPDWTDRTKRLLARAPGLDIFSQSLVVRDAQGWQIMEAGRALLAAIENPAVSPAV